MKIKKAYVILNGLKWSTTALKVYGQTYFTYQQAIDILNSSDMRIPTKEEFEELIKLPNLWDYKKNGIWFAEDPEDLASDNSLFLPANGFMDHPSMVIRAFNQYGYYWGFSDKYENYLTSLSLGKNQLFTHEYNVKYGHSVICILK